MKKMKLKEQSQFFIRGSDLLENGFTLLEVLQFLANLQVDQYQRYQSIIQELQAGVPIHEVLLKHDFDRHACATIYFAERHGFLSTSFKECGKYLLQKDQDQKRWFKLLQYPTILLCVLVFVSILLHTLLLPRFQVLYGTMGYKPSGITQFILYVLENFPYLLFFTFIILTIIILSIRRTLNKKTVLQRADFLASIPFFKTFYKLYQTIFLSREWSFLLKSGFSLNDIIHIMETQAFLPLMSETGKVIKRELLIGYSFSEAISNLNFIESEMVLIVAHGEKNGRLEKELLYYSRICAQKLEEMVMRFMMVVQPIIFSAIGLMVAIIYISIFFPMFQMIDSI